MNDQARGLVLWILGAVGVLLIYCGYKNVTPRSLIRTMVAPGTKLDPVDPQASGPATPATATPAPTGGSGPTVLPVNPLANGLTTNITPPTGAMPGAGNSGFMDVGTLV